MSPPAVLVLGDVVTDVIVRMREPLALGSDAAASISTHGGGAGGNVAAWLGYAGAAPTLVARVGDDDAGRVVSAGLARSQVGTALVIDPERPTGTVVVLVDPSGERSMLPDRGANLGLLPDDVPATALAAADHVHVSGYLLFDDGPRPAARHALDQARARGCPTSVDPSSVAPLRQVGPERFLSWVAGTDLLTPNLDELEVLAGTRDPEAGARSLARRGHEVVVTLGADGALWSDGDTVERIAADRVTAVDTTGAGDAFLAGYLTARLRGADPGGSMAAGASLAAEAVVVPGARPPGASTAPGPPTSEELGSSA